jgi:hypothetical protein
MYPDLLRLWDQFSANTLKEIEALGFDHWTSIHLLDRAIGGFGDGILIPAKGELYVEANRQARAISYAAAWFSLTANQRLQSMRPFEDRVAPVQSRHPLALCDQDTIQRDVERRFGVGPALLESIMTQQGAAIIYWIGVATVHGGEVIGEKCCCIGCARNLAKSSNRQRLAAAAILLAWCYQQQALDEIGREIARIRQPVTTATEGGPPA